MKANIAIPLALVVEVDSIPGCKTCSGQARGPVVFLRRSAPYRDGTRAHELEHVRQWWLGVSLGAALAGLAWHFGCPYYAPMAALSIALHPLAYKLIRPYRLWAEVRGTVAKLAAEGWPEALLAAESRDLAEFYDLDIGPDQARWLIEEAR